MAGGNQALGCALIGGGVLITILIGGVLVGIGELNTPPQSNDAQSAARASSATPSVASGGDASDPNTMDLATSETLAKENFSSMLKDPESARYTNVRAHQISQDGKSLYVFCGSVNAKNGFGGYDGAERFVATPVVSTLESSASDFDAAWTQMCSGPGQEVWF